MTIQLDQRADHIYIFCLIFFQTITWHYVLLHIGIIIIIIILSLSLSLVLPFLSLSCRELHWLDDSLLFFSRPSPLCHCSHLFVLLRCSCFSSLEPSLFSLYFQSISEIYCDSVLCMLSYTPVNCPPEGLINAARNREACTPEKKENWEKNCFEELIFKEIALIIFTLAIKYKPLQNSPSLDWSV